MKKTGYVHDVLEVGCFTEFYVHSRQEMPWVLSSGDSWIFGISHAGKGDDWKSIYTKPRPLFNHTMSLRETSEGKCRELSLEQLEALMSRAKAVMRILTVWVSSETNVLHATVA